MYKITTPISKHDFKIYFQTRWELLRKPWKQSIGSEKDQLENESVHRMAVANEQVIAVGRLHYINSTTAQIRYMAVKKEFEKRGIGKEIYLSLEKEARNKNIKLITLNAREQSIGFYEKLGFTVTKKTHVLFNQIQHFEMQKHL